MKQEWKKQNQNQSLRNLWNNNERSIICISSPRRREEKEEGRKSIWSNNDWKHPKFGKRYNIKFQETEQSINRLNPKKFTQRHIVIKVLKTKDKEKISWNQPEKNDSLPPSNLSNFSSATTEARRKEHSIFQVLKENNCQPWFCIWENYCSRIKRKWDKNKKDLSLTYP